MAIEEIMTCVSECLARIQERDALGQHDWCVLEHSEGHLLKILVDAPWTVIEFRPADEFQHPTYRPYFAVDESRKRQPIEVVVGKYSVEYSGDVVVSKDLYGGCIQSFLEEGAMVEGVLWQRRSYRVVSNKPSVGPNDYALLRE